jgi:hypothetical protein
MIRVGRVRLGPRRAPLRGPSPLPQRVPLMATVRHSSTRTMPRSLCSWGNGRHPSPALGRWTRAPEASRQRTRRVKDRHFPVSRPHATRFPPLGGRRPPPHRGDPRPTCRIPRRWACRRPTVSLPRTVQRHQGRRTTGLLLARPPRSRLLGLRSVLHRPAHHRDGHGPLRAATLIRPRRPSAHRLLSLLRKRGPRREGHPRLRHRRTRRRSISMEPVCRSTNCPRPAVSRSSCSSSSKSTDS